MHVVEPLHLPPAVVVMGVSGSGKTTVALQLAKVARLDFIEADEFHSARNVTLMAAGVPLTDEDRIPWLLAVRDSIRDATEEGRGVVVACSALKSAYREILRSAAPNLRFLALTPTRAALEARVVQRTDHFMPSSLLQSQLDTLEPLSESEVKRGGLTITETLEPESIATKAMQVFQIEAADGSLRQSQ